MKMGFLVLYAYQVIKIQLQLLNKIQTAAVKPNVIRSPYIRICSADLSAVHRKLLCAGEVGDHLASWPPAVLHCA